MQVQAGDGQLEEREGKPEAVRVSSLSEERILGCLHGPRRGITTLPECPTYVIYPLFP